MCLNISPALWHSCMSAILENLKSKKNFLHKMDNLLIHRTKKAKIYRREELLNTIFEKWFENICKEKPVV